MTTWCAHCTHTLRTSRTRLFRPQCLIRSTSTVSLPLTTRPPAQPSSSRSITPKIPFTTGNDSVTSAEQRAFFATEDFPGDPSLSWDTAQPIIGIEPGRLVEVRRTDVSGIGLILGNVIVRGRRRLLLLRASGELWPVISADVQFVFPQSLLDPSVAERCWSPALIEAYGRDEDISTTEIEGMLIARREAVMVMRRIMRETEDMLNQLSTSKPGSVENVFKTFANEREQTSISIVSTAEYLLDEREGSIPPHGLAAYATQTMLMRKPEMFLADTMNMWSSGKFIMRSKEEYRRLVRVSKISLAETKEDRELLDAFVQKCQQAIDFSRSMSKGKTGEIELVEHDLPQWSEIDKDIISVLYLRLAERRSIQYSPARIISTSILRAIDRYPSEIIEEGLVLRFLCDIGVRSPWDILVSSRVLREQQQASIISSTQLQPSGDFLKGNELDSLREDFSDQTVYVIDEASAEELDDGISLQRIHNSEDVWVHVHIADPTKYIQPSDPAAIHASFQGSSLYDPSRSIPLFPLDIIKKELSLGAKVERNEGRQGVMTFSARITKKGDVLDMKVRLGWIKSPKVMTYSSVDQLLGDPTNHVIRPFDTLPSTSTTFQSPEVTQEDINNLKQLREIAITLRRVRLFRSGLDWSQPWANVNILSSLPPTPIDSFSYQTIPSQSRFYLNSPPLDYTIPSRGTSSWVVAEYMVLAGRLAARFCSSNDLPVLYRGMAIPDILPSSNSNQSQMTLDELLSRRDPENFLSTTKDVLASGLFMSTVTLSPIPLSHWALGISEKKGYLRVTSPLRRFDDMLVHWQIKSFLARKKGLGAIRLTEMEIKTLMMRSEMGQRRVKNASQDADIWWQVQAIERFRNGGSSSLRLSNTASSEITKLHKTSSQHDQNDLSVMRKREKMPCTEKTNSSNEGDEMGRNVMKEIGKQEEVIDLGNLEGTIMGHMSLTPDGIYTIPIYLPELGTTGFLDAGPKENIGIGETVKVRVSHTRSLPRAMVVCRLI
ncbi:hypothetical protein M231_04423 [Tremella mesenterica]|uniref:RNB domain-containing protein n=1 Tax=Tremella mesenterica TaxID=5217 RepID=A0A4Q1BKE2_TREME|nr:uncharacterized protein TREMEDRAFT_43259 [Tremella mesenterica DSM 1558]EIW70565.1 hypothetical protein TREMEDRAFT_43259 [Tremella mesenterica DSM 1558]RXK38251.1 hypothetical protein M231_04423 [Tremella mesenterica]